MARDRNDRDRNDNRRYADDRDRGRWERGRDRNNHSEHDARAESYDDYDYGHDMDDYRRGGGNHADDYFDRGFGWFGRGSAPGYGAGPGPAYGRPFGPDYGTDFRDVSFGGRGSDVNTRDDIPRFARGHFDRGPHAGHGPEGYQRASERIIEDVNEHLTRHGHLDARRIRVSANDGEVTLEGTVDSRRAKRIAEDVAEDVPGVRDVHNRLRIDRGDG